MYAFVMTRSKPICFSFCAGIFWVTGWMTGTNAGVSTFPWFVCKIPILPATFCDPKVGTGIVTSVPADAPFDYGL